MNNNSDSDQNSGTADETTTKLKKDTHKFEDILSIVGGTGRWNWGVFLLASFAGMVSALHNLGYTFLAYQTDHWCLTVPTGDLDETARETVLNQTIPWKEKTGGTFQRSGCEMYDYNYSALTANDFLSNGFHDKNDDTVSCSKWEYNTSVFHSTVLSQWDLVCERKWMASVIQAIYMAGIMIGAPFFGIISDKYGRRRSVLIAVVIYIMAGFLCAGVYKSYAAFLIMRFALGLASPGVYAGGFVLTVEVFSPNRRALIGNLFCMPFALGYILLPLIAYFMRDWLWLQLVIASPSVLLILYFWFLPESPRWLLREGRIKEAEKILQRAANMNGRPMPPKQEFVDLLTAVSRAEREEYSSSANKKSPVVAKSDSSSPLARTWSVVLEYLLFLAKLVRTPRVRKRVLIIFFCWSVNGLVYYGLALNAPNFTSNVFLYIFLCGLLEVPAYLVPIPLIEKLGRKITFAGFLFASGAFLLLLIPIPSDRTDLEGLVIFLALSGKLCIGAAYALIYLYAAELLPTELRNTGLGWASLVGRIGSIIAPFIVVVLGDYHKAYPSIIFGSCAVAAGVSACFLPETRGRKLPDTVADVEQTDESQEEETLQL